MRKDEIENYITLQNSEHTIERITKELETDDTIIYTLVTSRQGYIYPRYVNLVALRLSTYKDYWVVFAPTEKQVITLGESLQIFFNAAWNNNIENKGGYK